MTITPAMAQFYEIKELYPDSVLFFRMGDFYEMFDEDALIAHRVLGIAVTTRNKNAETPTPLAGFPYHAKEKYLPLLVNAGYKVAIAEQVSDPKLKGIVRREVVRTVTPATLALEGESYDIHTQSQILVSVIKNKSTFGVSHLDLATNRWEVFECAGGEELQNYLAKLAPKEIVLSKELFGDEYMNDIFQKKIHVSMSYFNGSKKPKQILLKHFGVMNLEGFGIENAFSAQEAAALLLEYVESNQNSKLDFLQNISLSHISKYMEIDQSTLQSLDILYNLSTQSASKGTLFGVLNQTQSSLGAQYLRDQLTKPLQDIGEIQARQDFITAFLDDKIMLDSVRKELGSLSNIHSILNRLALGRANPKDLLVLKKSLESIQNIFCILEKSSNPLFHGLIK